MMVPIREEVLISSPRIASSSSIAWFYFVGEFIIGAALSASFAILSLVKSHLPKPPRDLTGDVVLVTGASSTLGKCMADEFARNGCIIICLDADKEALRESTTDLASRHPKIKDIGPYYRAKNSGNNKYNERIHGYECDPCDRDSIREIARRVENEIGQIDVLVTCTGQTGQDIFETVNTTLMSHYWTILAFLPSMLRLERAHIIGITPTSSTEDAYAGSRAAVTGLMESLGHEFGGRNSQLNFITVAPKADPRLLRHSEEQVAREVVQAVRRDQCTINASWLSSMLYRTSCAIHDGITTITRWFHTQGCEYPY